MAATITPMRQNRYEAGGAPTTPAGTARSGSIRPNRFVPYASTASGPTTDQAPGNCRALSHGGSKVPSVRDPGGERGSTSGFLASSTSRQRPQKVTRESTLGGGSRSETEKYPR